MGLLWKIFAWFMVAIAATLAGSLYASLRLTDFGFRQVDVEVRERIHNAMQSELTRGGRPALESWLRANPRPATSTVVLVWEASRGRRGGPPRELLGRPFPWALDVYLNQRVERVEWQLTPRLTGPGGDQYAYMFTKAPVTVLGLFTAPGLQVAVVSIALVAGLATALGLAVYLSSPILRLQRASRALAAGALDTRVGDSVARRNDELGTLARDFDRMAERIQALVTDKETLLRDVSHELRSPLARIRVALALAQRKSASHAQTDLARIELETERLDALVGQVMKLSRLRTATEPPRRPLQLGEIVSGVVDDARFEHPGRTINFVAPGPLPMTGDPDGLKSAIENVLRNALFYSPAEKPIDVMLERTQRSVEIRIRDRGPGVEPIHLKRIFEPFYRTDESRDHRQDGQGIGLAITARVMELHGGSVEAANCADGGLQITLKLPNEPSPGLEKPRRKQEQ